MKKLRICLIGDDETTMKAIQLVIELGHEIRCCVTNAQSIISLCENENISYNSDLKQIDPIDAYIDCYIALTDIVFEEDVIPTTVWPKLFRLARYGSKNENLFKPIFPQISRGVCFYWYVYLQHLKNIFYVDNIPCNFNDDEGNRKLEMFYSLLIEISRDNVTFTQFYEKKSKAFPQELVQYLYEYNKESRFDIKIVLLAALCRLLKMYFPYSKEDVRIGLTITKREICRSLLKEIRFIPDFFNETSDFNTLCAALLEEIITISFEEGILSYMMDNKQKHFEVIIYISSENNLERQLDSHKLLFQFHLSNEESCTLEILHMRESCPDILIMGLLDNFILSLQEMLISNSYEFSKIIAKAENKIASTPNQDQTATHNVIASFDNQAKKNPDKIAIVYQGKLLTYRELQQHSYNVAANLIQKGISPGDYVAVLSDRSMEFIACVLGVMRSGACYIPLNPKSPISRIQHILNVAKPKLFLYYDEEFEITTESTAINLTTIIKSNINISNQLIQSKSLAYIIFTSGTTGLPKGVVIDHGSLIDRLNWLINRLDLTSEEIILHHTNIEFDVSIEEIFLPLILGAKLVLASQKVHEQLNLFTKNIISYGVTYIEFVPSLLNLVLDLPDFSVCRSLRYVISGGEALSYFLVNKYYKVCHAALINFYGPTECTINATYYFCRPNELERSRYVPIGIPVGNVQLHVLNQNLNPVPHGGIGELCISGYGIATGYINQTQLIESVTIDHGPGIKIYRTGDLVRYIDDENLEFIARVDRQIKLRGHRIELEEIESVLTRYPNVKQTAVLIDDANINKKLVAYVSFYKRNLSNHSQESQDALRLFCSEFLNSYMIPNSFVFVENIPLTQSGKINFDELKKLTIDKEICHEDHKIQSEVEKVLLETWSHILGENVEVNSNFFDLGGNSLSAVQVVSELAKKQIIIEVADIFQHATIADLVAYYGVKSESNSVIMINSISNNQKIPLSFAQQRLWYLYQLDGTKNSAYNIAMAFKFDGNLNINALEASINCLIERHEILRTIFKSEEGKPWQEILRKNYLFLSVELISETDLELTLIEETHIPFNIETGPLARYKLYQLSTNCHVFSVTMHNIITDGWSESIFINELNQIYNALISNIDIMLAPLPFQYRDFSNWQRQYFSQAILKEKLNFWVKNLNDYSELNLQPNFKIKYDSEILGQDVKFNFRSLSLIKNLEKLSKEVHTTPYTILVTAFKIMLAQYCNQEDIVIGTGMAGRNFSYLDKLIGFFVNTVVLRTDLSGNPTFYELIERVKSTCIAAHQFQDVPFEMIVDALQLERQLGKNPIFQVLFIMQKTGNDVNFSLKDINSSNILVNRKTATFDLTFNISLTSDSLTGDIQYNAKLFSRDQVQKWLKSFEDILEYMLNDPSQSIHSLSPISKAELVMLKQWNKTEVFFSNDDLHRIIEKQAHAVPHKHAIIYKNVVITYGELNKKANQLAHYLTEKFKISHPRKQKVIGVSIERSIDYVVGIFAILKLGAAFLPLDPELPIERITYYAKHADVNIILSNSDNPYLKDLHKIANVLLLDADHVEISQQSIYDLTCQANEICYVIFTSGTTGLPKGVVIKHNGVTNLLHALRLKLDFSQKDKFLSLTSINFDIFYLELFLPLVCGGLCIIAEQSTLKDCNLVSELINIRKPTFIQATPSFWNMFINSTNLAYQDIKILVGGETLVPALAAKLFFRFKEVFNVYGPTETTIWSTFKRISDPNYVTIGTPLANTKCYVLDKYLNQLPINVIGELYISGKGLAAQYLNDSELSTKMFIKNPICSDENEDCYSKMYRTGDYVRYLSDGEIQYIGREDHQVKVRGHRIELQEIESIILKYDEIKETIVIVKNINNYENILVAFYIPKNVNSLVEEEDIKNFITNYLPNYMIPSKWVKIFELPKTSNGKTDRKLLSKINLDEITFSNTDKFIAPITIIEQQIISIFSDVLILDSNKISLNDSFFMIGGHSLLIPQIVSKINKNLQTQITISDFIMNPTPEKLCDLIKNKVSCAIQQSQ